MLPRLLALVMGNTTILQFGLVGLVTSLQSYLLLRKVNNMTPLQAADHKQNNSTKTLLLYYFGEPLYRETVSREILLELVDLLRSDLEDEKMSHKTTLLMLCPS